ncbi:MAG: alcohol dehydrogenase zinc-binding domain protein [Conexibacter sp.]|nr:alcohol dehydrogenase zinc-binding domain protein [Conexibacter sp.]
MMKAAVVRDVNELSIEDIDVPEPGPGEVLIRLAATGICHTDLSALRGNLPTAMPTVLGHEGAGVVERVGPGVKTSKPGDHVVTTITNSCGACFQCLGSDPSLCEVSMGVIFGGTMLDGTTRLSRGNETLFHFFCQSSFAEYAVLPERSAIPIRKDAPLDVVASLACGAMTGIGAVIRRAQVPAGSSVVIVGAGGVGLSAVMAAAAVGANPIIVADITDDKLALARSFGATHTLNTSDRDLVAGVNSITGRGADYAFDAVGTSSTLEQAFGSVRSGGQVVAVGIMNTANLVTLDIFSLIMQKSLTGTMGGSVKPFIDIPAAVDLYMDGRLPLDRLVSKKYSLAELPQAFDAMESGALEGRGVVVF